MTILLSSLLKYRTQVGELAREIIESAVESRDGSFPFTSSFKLWCSLGYPKETKEETDKAIEAYREEWKRNITDKWRDRGFIFQV